MAETVDIPSTEQPDTWEKIDDALLGGVQLELVGEPETDAPEEAPTEPAETQEVEPEAEIVEPETVIEDGLNYDQEIPLPDEAGPVKLGELKDGYVAYQRREADMQRREADIASEYGKLAQINAEMQANGAPLSQEQMQQVQHMQAQRIQREAQLMMDTIPEWKDQAAYQKDRQEIVEMLAPYGITENMVNSVADHRIALLYKHHLDLVRRVRRAEEMKPVAPAPKKAPKGHRAPVSTKKTQVDKLVQHAKASGNEDIEMAAIDALIGG